MFKYASKILGAGIVSSFFMLAYLAYLLVDKMITKETESTLIVGTFYAFLVFLVLQCSALVFIEVHKRRNEPPTTDSNETPVDDG